MSFKPTSEMASAAKRGLLLRTKYNKGGTSVGVARARDIMNRKNLSASTVNRMVSFFARHEGNQAGGENDAGYISWLLWGGDSGKAWAKKTKRSLEKSGILDLPERDLADSIQLAAAKTDPLPSSKDYVQGTFSFRGLKIAIENPKGSVRIGRGWQCTAPAHYGYFIETFGADGDEVDVFVGEHINSDRIFIVNQQFNGIFDEHKVMIGFQSAEEAVATYRSAYEPGFIKTVNIEETDISGLKVWLKSPAKKPYRSSVMAANFSALKKIQKYYIGKRGKSLKSSDFVFPSVRAFPVTNFNDVKAAISSFGRSRFKDQYGLFKKRLIAIARRKGLLDAIPDKWKREAIQKRLSMFKEFRITNLAKGFEIGDQMFLFGVVLQPEVVDTQGHIISREVIKKAARRHTSSYRRVGLRHKGMVTSNDVVLTQSFINETESDLVMHGITIPVGAWAVEHEVLNPGIKEMVKSGHYNGYSVGGSILKTSKY